MAILKSGVLIGDYRIVRKIRVGGMSTVYRATRVDGTEVAVKVLHPELAGDKARQREFDHEARITETLSHPNIIRLVSYAKDAVPPHFAMEYFPGKNLKVEMVRNRDFVLCHMRGILLQAVDALDYLHAKAVVHTDLKPENLLVDARAGLRLIDFALSRRMERGLRLRFGRRTVRGTRQYMSPEQIRGKRLDERSDIYALGATMYDIYVGRPPFASPDLAEILTKHLYEQPLPMREAGADVPLSLDRLVLRMLEKEPRKRPQSMLAVRHALENL